ncbi:MAG: Holliday junction branch migration protein RuvA [Candidatus Tagabacteria bacterium CG09_land_8_20_14_0_10_41_14]|uniref:Holliday junction branch migration complex subunit RuvA n=2 Tax=Candidatus Tagaibacteriota TaxID=1817918 RepID=A0A2H0WKJ9_9BACT|nr:MAG: Holliday junction branch migration protein RuvA [Candidatus Tagabacteria bacterium CG09_land_8_20_14_0_10_41_14]PJE73228.1 MAG: Holliday junction branch migration protein RuvA [Candidatus Tagabacteria bacterium CG10_big_fil_rev_8_21_14_0_10_40_13]
MISQLAGIIKFKTDKFILVDVGGVGYRVFVSFETQKKLPRKGEKVEIWTHLHVRENIMALYGFLNYAELEFFGSLIQISGIGPKSALAVLAVAPLDVLKKAVSSGDVSYLTKVSGVGKKLAEKIVLELRDKVGLKGAETKAGGLKEEEEAIEALQALGYSLKQSREALRDLPRDIEGTENIIKKALRQMHEA